MRGGLRRLLVQLASAPDHDLTPSKLPLLHRSLLPILSFASSLYGFSLFVRRNLHRWGLLREHRLPVPVVSVGNLTWGGNGKTPMTEFLARFFADAGLSPLILTRGYAGGDEAAMLHRHLLKLKTPARIGVGANRVAVAADFFERYGYVCGNRLLAKNFSRKKCGSYSVESKIGVSILDDGLQHWSLSRNMDIVMVNGMMPWGNGHLLPRGTLREPLDAIRRADIGVIHHADLMGALHVDQLDFIDHHFIERDDIELIRQRLRKLESGFQTKAVAVVTEKDYDRDPAILRELHEFEVLVICSSLEIMPFSGRTVENFEDQLMKVLHRNIVDLGAVED